MAAQRPSDPPGMRSNGENQLAGAMGGEGGGAGLGGGGVQVLQVRLLSGQPSRESTLYSLAGREPESTGGLAAAAGWRLGHPCQPSYTLSYFLLNLNVFVQGWSGPCSNTQSTHGQPELSPYSAWTTCDGEFT